MARIRTVKPDFWGDQKLGKMSPYTRLLYLALFNLSDDEGYFEGDTEQLAGDVFKYDPNPREMMAWAIQELLAARRIIVYDDDDDCRFGYMPKFLTHQRVDSPKPSTRPKPDDCTPVLDVAPPGPPPIVDPFARFRAKLEADPAARYPRIVADASRNDPGSIPGESSNDPGRVPEHSPLDLDPGSGTGNREGEGGPEARERAGSRPPPASPGKTAAPTALAPIAPDEVATVRGLVDGVMRAVGLDAPAELTADHRKCALVMLKGRTVAQVVETCAEAVRAKPKLREKVPSLFVPRFVDEDWPKFQAAVPPAPGKPAAVSPARAAREARLTFVRQRALQLEEESIARGELVTPAVRDRITAQVSREADERFGPGARAGPGGAAGSTDSYTGSTSSKETS